MLRNALVGASLALLVSSVACGGRAIPPLDGTDGGKIPDAGPPDAGPVDAGHVDAGPVDAGPLDAGPVDAGNETGFPDGGPPTACVTHAQCNSPLVCIEGFCSDPGTVGTGFPCSATRDCVSGLYCAPTAPQPDCFTGGKGGADAGCTSDADCQAGLRCNYVGLGGVCGAGGTGDFEDSCSVQTDCLPGLFCSPPAADGGGQICTSYANAFPTWGGVSCSDDTDGGHFYFQVPRPGTPLPDFFRLPYPNDIRVTNGVLDISDFPTPGPSLLGVDVVALYKSALTADFAGFSPIAPVTFRSSVVLDDNTLVSNTANNVVIADLTHPNTNTFYWSYEFVINQNRYNCDNRLTIGPGESTPYQPGDTYAVILLDGVRDTTGAPVMAQADFNTLIASTSPADTTLGNAYAAYAPLRTYLAANNTLHPIAAAVFTVGNPQATMAAVAATVKSQPPPGVIDEELCGYTAPSTCDALGADHACSPTDGGFFEIHGRMGLPIFQQGTAPYATPDAGGDIVVLADGGAEQVGNPKAVCFALAIPKTAAPAAGWPLVITSHGTDGSMTDFITSGVASRLAAGAPAAAVLGFDAVEHADRRGGSSENPEDLVFNILSPRAARDNFLQGASDILTEAKMADEPLSFDAGPSSALVFPVTFDPTQVVFFGHSQGSTSGELALPFLDAAPAAVLSGSGAHLTESLLYKTSPVNSAVAIAALIQEDSHQLDDQHPVLGLWQNFFDRSDPINSNPSIINSPLTGHTPHNILMTWGMNDTFTPEQTLNANAASLGVPLAGPQVLDGGGPSSTASLPLKGNFNVAGTTTTDAVLQFANTQGEDGHFVAFSETGAETDWSGFIASAMTEQSYVDGGAPTIP